MDQEPQDFSVTDEIAAPKDDINIKPAMSMNEKIQQEFSTIVISPTDKDKYGRLIGPNGKPSLLDERHWRMVRTPTFIEWFGDWKDTDTEHGAITDENGEPQLLWHASRKADVERFEVDKLLFGGGSPRFQLETLRVKGVYFNRSKEYMDEFARHNSVNTLYGVFVNVQYPLRREGIVNSNSLAPEYVDREILGKRKDSIVSDEGGKANTVIVFNPSNILIVVKQPYTIAT